MKSVPNLISYLHEFFQNISQPLAICFELFSFGVIFNSEIADERAPPVRRRVPHRARAVARRCRMAAMRRAIARGLKPLSGQRAARPDSPPRARRRRPDNALAPLITSRPPHAHRCRPDRLADRAVARTAAPAALPLARRCRAAPPFLAVSHAPAPCRRRLTEQRRH
jgi:hypothetical protein